MLIDVGDAFRWAFEHHVDEGDQQSTDETSNVGEEGYTTAQCIRAE